jgi:hypothetical protein
MEKIEITTEELYRIIKSEGYGYGLMDYYGKIKGDADNPKTKELWNNAVEALNQLRTFFNLQVTNGEIEEFEY